MIFLPFTPVNYKSKKKKLPWNSGNVFKGKSVIFFQQWNFFSGWKQETLGNIILFFNLMEKYFQRYYSLPIEK